MKYLLIETPQYKEPLGRFHKNSEYQICATPGNTKVYFGKINIWPRRVGTGEYKVDW